MPAREVPERVAWLNDYLRLRLGRNLRPYWAARIGVGSHRRRSERTRIGIARRDRFGAPPNERIDTVSARGREDRSIRRRHVGSRSVRLHNDKISRRRLGLRRNHWLQLGNRRNDSW